MSPATRAYDAVYPALAYQFSSSKKGFFGRKKLAQQTEEIRENIAQSILVDVEYFCVGIYYFCGGFIR